MCKPFRIARETVMEYVENERKFEYEEIQREIISRGGVLRVAPGVSIYDYLTKLQDRNLIYFSRTSNKYGNVKALHRYKEEVLSS